MLYRRGDFVRTSWRAREAVWYYWIWLIIDASNARRQIRVIRRIFWLSRAQWYYRAACSSPHGHTVWLPVSLEVSYKRRNNNKSNQPDEVNATRTMIYYIWNTLESINQSIDQQNALINHLSHCNQQPSAFYRAGNDKLLHRPVDSRYI